MSFGARRFLLAALALGFASTAHAEALKIYGPGGPAPAMREAAGAFELAHGIKVEVTAGPTPQWAAKAKEDADLIFSGSENMMSGFATTFADQIIPSSIKPLYLRASAILVRPGNPKSLNAIADLLKPGIKIMIVEGAGQAGLWEDIVGRMRDIEKLRAFRNNIVYHAPNTGVARQRWLDDASIDAWVVWTIWQIAKSPEGEAIFRKWGWFKTLP